MLKNLIDIFRIRKEERLSALVALSCFVILNALNIVRYYDSLSVILKNPWWKFIRGWKVGGFDPITYCVVTEWTSGYNIYRHPLLAYMMWPLSKLNGWLMELTGVNLAIILVAFLIVFCAFYSYVFVSRILHDVIGLKRSEANVLAVLTFSFAYVMLSAMAPDHFILSMFCLTLTLYLCGKKLKNGSALNMWQTIVMFFITGGITLNNGLKVFLAAMVTRRKRFFEWRFLLFAVVLPSAILWGSARWSYKQFVWPKEMERHERKVRVEKRMAERIRKSVTDTISVNDTAVINRIVEKAVAEQKAKQQQRYKNSAAYKNKGKAMGTGEFSRWTDISTSRVDVAVECLFGEGIMIHEDYLLGDVLVNRPVVVHYRNWFNYVVEAILIILFVLGVWYGRKHLFLWTAMSCFLMDMVLHMGFGFGINEISIMSAHYLFVMPIAMAYMLNALEGRKRKAFICLLGALGMYIVAWNVSFVVSYLYF